MAVSERRGLVDETGAIDDRRAVADELFVGEAEGRPWPPTTMTTTMTMMTKTTDVQTSEAEVGFRMFPLFF